ncbi:MAG: class I SAM-dependent methyltransferase [Acidimicrobiales bacterium]|nr:class I SAM-dependent methyltransferase [Acidimicrobiales bacterium]
MTNSLRDDERIRSTLDRLYAANDAQEADNQRWLSGEGSRSTIGTEAEVEAGRAFWADKYVALDRDKAELCYLLCRMRGARRIVEAGTSFGVSTLFLATAVRDNGGGVVIGTERETEKVAVARQNFESAGVSDLIELREGDLRQTLAPDDGPVDLLLLDIWVAMVPATVELVAPRIPVGGVIIADNTITRRADYEGLFNFLDDPSNGFTTMTLPMSNGLEMAVRTT